MSRRTHNANNNNSQQANGTQEVPDKIQEDVQKEKNKWYEWANRKYFKGKLSTWIFAFSLLGTTVTFVTPLVEPIISSVFPGEEITVEQKIEEALQQQKEQYELLLQKIEEADEQEDASYELQIDVLKQEIERLNEKIEEMEKQLEESE